MSTPAARVVPVADAGEGDRREDPAAGRAPAARVVPVADAGEGDRREDPAAGRAPAARVAPVADAGEGDRREGPVFPIRNYDRLTAVPIIVALSNLDVEELMEVRTREQAGKGRANILGRIDMLIQKENGEKATPSPDQLRVTPPAGTGISEPPGVAPVSGPAHPGRTPATSAGIESKSPPRRDGGRPVVGVGKTSPPAGSPPAGGRRRAAGCCRRLGRLRMVRGRWCEVRGGRRRRLGLRRLVQGRWCGMRERSCRCPRLPRTVPSRW